MRDFSRWAGFASDEGVRIMKLWMTTLLALGLLAGSAVVPVMGQPTGQGKGPFGKQRKGGKQGKGGKGKQGKGKNGGQTAPQTN